MNEGENHVVTDDDAINNKSSDRHRQGPQEPEKPGQLHGGRCPGKARNQEIGTEHGLQLIVIYQYWFMNCNIYHTKTVIVGEMGTWCRNSLYHRLNFFCKSKAGLKIKFI